MFGIWGKSFGVCLLTAATAVAATRASAPASEFHFDRDTFAFQNATVLKYHDGIAFFRPKAEVDDPANKYTRRCFVMTRTVMQFRKFARFDPRAAPLSDQQLATRIRAVAHLEPWREPTADNQRISFPGYANLREISKARAQVF